MKIRSLWLQRAFGLALHGLLRAWMGSLDFRAAYYDRASDPALPEFQGPVLFCIWHEYTPVPIYLRPHCRLSILVSRHADAEALAQAGRFEGFEIVRGSTARGGVAALRELVACGQCRNLAIAPDGPRGPRRSFAPGPIFIASRLGIPIVLIAPGYDRPWRLKTWDRFALPRPGSRCRIIMSRPIRVPPDLDRDGLESYRTSLESLYDVLTGYAESWAEGRIEIAPQSATQSESCSQCRIDPIEIGTSSTHSPKRRAA
ncbi:MAG: DUF374 domain-containing protein [Planctomycetes bacterium]|nr:DUF374 domain-containing protein [Planctomycetota bacterium]